MSYEIIQNLELLIHNYIVSLPTNKNSINPRQEKRLCPILEIWILSF